MNQETIVFPSGNKAIKLTPGEGYTYIKNGGTWVREAVLKEGSDVSVWRDASGEPPTPEEPIDDSEALSIITGGDSNDTE